MHYDQSKKKFIELIGRAERMNEEWANIYKFILQYL